MRFTSILTALSALSWIASATSDGLQDVVTWDSYSLLVNDTRVFVYAGEFHYQRLPVPELWLDVFQKFKANGFNAVSIYFFWSYHSPSEGVYDVETAGKNVQRVLDYAKEAGLYVIARPGPYCNAESNGGGLALWGSDGSFGTLRTSATAYYDAWQPWMTLIGEIIAANQVTEGGTVILTQVENELQETTHSATNTLVVYMEQIEANLRAAGITIPFSSNEKGERSESWSVDYLDVGGSVNVYGLDSYPGGFSCNSSTGFNVVRNYYQWFQNYSSSQPEFWPEFEGGYFTPWGGSFYDTCDHEHQPAFADVFYKNNIGQRGTLQSLYMAYGGTNWGHSAAPVVYSSYDYSAPLRETREIWPKFSATKLVGLFTRVSQDLLKTEMINNGTGYAVSSTGIWTWYIQNPDTSAGFYVVQQASTPSTASIDFDAYLETSEGTVTVPVNLDGRQSKILVTDYSFGDHTLLYATADIATYGVFDSADVLVFYVSTGQTSQFAFKGETNLTYTVYGSSGFNSSSTNGTQTFTYTQTDGQTVVKFSNGVIAYLLDVATAWTFWAPPTTTNPIVLPSEHIFAIGPYLVRSTSISGSSVLVNGDNEVSTPLEVFVGNSKVKTIVWNGHRLNTTVSRYGSLLATAPGAEDRKIKLPSLTQWKSGDSLPEKNPKYDDSKWVIANKTTTQSPVAPLTLPVLFSSDYGYYTGAKIYRGYFNTTSDVASVNITASGGLAFGWNAWLNGKLIGGSPGDAALTTTSALLTFPSGTLSSNTSNVLTVVVDYHGHDETSTTYGLRNPRGILGAALLTAQNATSTATFSTWKIQGNAGGSDNLDPVRGPMNEGGLYGERLGWHLPGFDTSKLHSSLSPQTGLNSSGIAFYVTTFKLDLDADLDVPIGIELGAPAGTVARAMIFVNGYQYGKYVPQIGPQTRFPIPPGVLNNRGTNTLAISLWAQTDAGAQLDTVELFAYGAYQSSFDFNADWSYLQPGYNGERAQFV